MAHPARLALKPRLPPSSQSGSTSSFRCQKVADDGVSLKLGSVYPHRRPHQGRKTADLASVVHRGTSDPPQNAMQADLALCVIARACEAHQAPELVRPDRQRRFHLHNQPPLRSQRLQQLSPRLAAGLRWDSIQRLRLRRVIRPRLGLEQVTLV